MRRLIIGAGVAAVVLFGATAAVASSNNDVVLHENQYKEYFKQEGHGDKNYLYTVTSITDPFGRRCVVVTGASETAIALDCINPKG